MIQRIKVLLASATTWLMVGQTGVAGAAVALHNDLPGNTTAQTISTALVTAAAVIGGVILVVRRTVEVIPAQRQILPLAGPPIANNPPATP